MDTVGEIGSFDHFWTIKENILSWGFELDEIGYWIESEWTNLMWQTQEKPVRHKGKHDLVHTAIKSEQKERK